ncbi:prolipoprotein diacylglyceryl transferase [Oxalobacteraceae bacterium R-40]|uniref:Phosphatidylglycerol--prolipoprotein diacylglyceryl transferase n=1 Tax=Keguizhuia sedimenti TaxID=3064264 RepID=A0ABU1BM74_9BURK|nr:prolipoprotein diacylglyceryl transferase [Oxalobacteraceae bacterium R-40]
MLTHPMPDPIAISLGPLSVHWYGLMYLVAFAQFLILGRMRIKQPHIAAAGWKKEDLDDMLFYGVLGVVVGGRLGEVLFYHPAYYFSNPLEILAVWKGGMSFHGGFLGVMIAMALWGRKADRNLMDVLDFIAPMVPLGYAAGRIGNFINAELPGRLADPSLPWAMIWPNVDNLPRHPSPIYQALVDGLLLFLIVWFFARKPRPRMAVSGLFALGYGCARFFTEYFRTPDYEVPLGGLTISAGQMLSVPMIVLGVVLLTLAYKKPEARLDHSR